MGDIGHAFMSYCRPDIDLAQHDLLGQYLRPPHGRSALLIYGHTYCLGGATGMDTNLPGRIPFTACLINMPGRHFVNYVRFNACSFDSCL